MNYFNIGELFAKTAEMTQEKSTEKYAESSKFYSKIMEDGNIFNPYIHRRWITAQFCALFKTKKEEENPLECIIRVSKIVYNSEKINKWFIHECEVMELLKKKDKVAYEERSTVLSLDDMKEMLMSRVDNRSEFIMYGSAPYKNYLVKSDGYNSYYYGYYKISEEFKKRILSADSYKELLECCKILNDWNLVNRHGVLDFNLCYDESPVLNYFLKQGAYYTIRNLVTFDGMELDGKKGQEAIDLIRSQAKQPAFVLIPIAYDLAKKRGFINR